VANQKGGDAQCIQGEKTLTQTGNAAPTFNPKGRGNMNKTEREFAMILEAQKRKGEILRYEYEGMTLRWPVGEEIISYTPDFIVFLDITCWSSLPLFKFIEVKGGFIKGKFERAIERFRHARTYWPEFSFELWQKQKTGWKRLS
jgi:hypothetical protein